MKPMWKEKITYLQGGNAVLHVLKMKLIPKTSHNIAIQLSMDTSLDRMKQSYFLFVSFFSTVFRLNINVQI